MEKFRQAAERLTWHQLFRSDGEKRKREEEENSPPLTEEEWTRVDELLHTVKSGYQDPGEFYTYTEQHYDKLNLDTRTIQLLKMIHLDPGDEETPAFLGEIYGGYRIEKDDLEHETRRGNWWSDDTSYLQDPQHWNPGDVVNFWKGSTKQGVTALFASQRRLYDLFVDKQVDWFIRNSERAEFLRKYVESGVYEETQLYKDVATLGPSDMTTAAWNSEGGAASYPSLTKIFSGILWGGGGFFVFEPEKVFDIKLISKHKATASWQSVE